MRKRQLIAAIRRLPSSHQEILMLRHRAGVSNAEAAALLGLTPRSASHLYSAAIRQLKREQDSVSRCFQPFSSTVAAGYRELEAVA